MKQLLISFCIFIIACGAIEPDKSNTSKLRFSETDILKQLDLAFNGTPSEYFPNGRPQDVKYNFFLDLEDGYCVTAGSKIHLYADSSRWVIVFEKSGYYNRGFNAEIELDYVGTCIDYPIDEYPDRNYITNASRIILIDAEEFKKIENKEGQGLEIFELIAPETQQINIRDSIINFDNDYRNYEKLGIKVREYDNPRNLIGFEDLVRYVSETNPSVISATETEIRQHIPIDIPKLMTIDAFHLGTATSNYGLPGKMEAFQLIAKILVSGDTSFWRPTLKPNNHWSNWESGNL